MSPIRLEREKISQGIFFNHVFSDTYKTDYIHLYFSLPLTKETAAQTALLSRVLIRGSQRYPDLQSLNRALDGCYSANLDTDVFKSGENQVLAFSASCLADPYALNGESITQELLAILGDVIFCPYTENGGFEPSRLAGEKQNAVDAVWAQINNKISYARKRMYETMCQNEPYSVDPLGEEATLLAMDGKKLKAAYDRLLQTAHVEIFHVGRSEPKAVKDYFAAAFAAVPRSPEKIAKAQTVTPVPPSPRLVRETGDVTQANLVLGFRTFVTLTADDYFAFTVFNAVLGGSLTSKLFVNVREKLSLCYSIGSRPDTSKGVMAVYCGIDGDKFDQAYEEILHQWDLTRRGEITQTELEQSTKALVNALTGLEDTPSAIADWFYSRILAGDLRSPEEIVQGLGKVTAKDVAAAADKIRLDTVYVLEGEKKEKNHG